MSAGKHSVVFTAHRRWSTRSRLIGNDVFCVDIKNLMDLDVIYTISCSYDFSARRISEKATFAVNISSSSPSLHLPTPYIGLLEYSEQEFIAVN